jgi:hypothetical protein
LQIGRKRIEQSVAIEEWTDDLSTEGLSIAHLPRHDQTCNQEEKVAATDAASPAPVNG